jgi:hypothetical protein
MCRTLCRLVQLRRRPSPEIVRRDQRIRQGTRTKSRLSIGTIVAIISAAVMAMSVAAGLFGFALHH